MGLPTSRDVTLAGGGPFPSTTGNRMQDSIIGHELVLRALGPGFLYDGLFWPRQNSTGATRPLGRCGTMYAHVSGAGPTLKFRGGLWVQNSGNAMMPYFAYRTIDDEISVDMDPAPGSGLYRRDIVSVKLSAPSTAIEIDVQYTVGTPAASDVGATEPSTPSGYTKICSALIQDADIDILATAVRDYRTPLGMKVFDVPGHLFSFDDTAHYGRSTPTLMTADGSGARPAYALPEQGWANMRLMRVGLVSLVGSGSTAAAKVTKVDMAALTSTDLFTPTGIIVANDGLKYREYDLETIALPWWMDGTSSGMAAAPSAPSTSLKKLALKFTSGSTDADKFTMARFICAGGFDAEIA